MGKNNCELARKINSENPFLHFLTPRQPEMVKETSGRKEMPPAFAVIREWRLLAQAIEAGD